MAPARRKKTSAAAAAAMAAQWKVGDLVLAKMKGFPAWPAMISEPEKWGLGSVKNKILVYFYGTQQIAFCNYADLELFTEEKKKTILSKRHGKGSDFVRAVEEIVAIYEDLKKQNQNDVISGTNLQNNLTSELPNESIPDEAQSSNLNNNNNNNNNNSNNNNNTINSNNTAEQQCIVNSVPDEPIEKVPSILDELRQNPFSTSVTTKKRNRESQPQNPNPNPNSSKRTRLQRPLSFGLDKSAENEPFNAKINGYIFEPLENETLEKEAGSSTATGERDLPPKTVFCKRKRRPNRKRSTSNSTGLEYSKKTNQETLNPKQNYNESDESGEPLPDLPNSNSNSNSRNNEVNNKSDGDEHLPLVKRARVRMERSLVEEPKLNPNNGESGFFKPNEAALPPSKRLHRALEAMSANVAETTDEKIESSAGSVKLVQNGYGLEGPKLHTSDSPKVKEESSSSKLSPLESHKMPQLVSQEVKESGGIILERPKLPLSASPEAILENHKLPPSASPKAFLESPKLSPPASPKVFLKSPKLPPSTSSEVFLKSPKLPPSASSEAFLENPKLPPSASSEAFLKSPKLAPSASSEAFSENPKLPPASSEVSLERPELHHLASQVDSPKLPELASSETKQSEKSSLESLNLCNLTSEDKISEKPPLESPKLETLTSEVKIYEKPSLESLNLFTETSDELKISEKLASESPKLHALVSEVKISEKTGLESPNLDSLASEVRISEKIALESPNLPKQASPEAKLSKTALENAELEVKPDEICEKVPENITIPLEKISQSEVFTKNESHLSENMDANADINSQNVGPVIISDTGAERVTVIPEPESVSSASNYDADTRRDVITMPESAQTVSIYDADVKRDAIVDGSAPNLGPVSVQSDDNAQTGESHISQVTTTPMNNLIPSAQAKRPVSSKNLLESPLQEPSGSSTTQLQQPPTCPLNPSVVRVPSAVPSTSTLNPPIVRVPSAVPNTSPLNPSMARVPSIVPNTSPLNPPVVRVPSVVPSTSPLNPPIVRVPTVAPSTSPLNPPIVRVPSAVSSTSPLNPPTVRVPSVVPSSVAHASRKAFEAFISTLTRTKDSIGRATRLAMECAKYGNAGEVMDIILETLEKESNLHKRVDFFFLVDSITQWSRNQKGGAGDVYIPLLQSVLPRILCSVAPPGVSAWDNRKHCLKVLKLWLERKTLPEYMIRQHIRELESMNDASFSTSSLRRPTRTERPLNDPVREMEGMLVDEYGSNTSFQLPPDFRSTLTEASDDEEGPVSSSSSEEKIFEAVTPERDPNVSPNAADNKHRLVLAEVDGELEMEDVSPVNNASSIESDRPVNGTSMESNRVVNSTSVFAPPLPYDRPPSPPPLPASPPPPPPGASAPYKAKNQQPHQVNPNPGASQSVQFYSAGYRAPPPPPPPQPLVNNFRTPSNNNNNNNNNNNFGPPINQPPLHNNGCNNNNNNNTKGYHVPPQPPPYSAYPQYPYPESPYHRDNRGFRGPSEVSYGPPRPDCGHYGPPPRPGSSYPPPSRPHVGSPSAAHGYWRPR